MKINFNTSNLIKPYLQKAGRINVLPSFKSAKTRKMIDEIKNAKNLKHINLTFDDMVDIYNDLGYDVILKRGSHAVIPITDKVNLPVVIPHGEKFIHIHDIKRLKFILNGEIEKALTTK